MTPEQHDLNCLNPKVALWRIFQRPVIDWNKDLWNDETQDYGKSYDTGEIETVYSYQKGNLKVEITESISPFSLWYDIHPISHNESRFVTLAYPQPKNLEDAKERVCKIEEEYKKYLQEQLNCLQEEIEIFNS